MIKVTIRIQEFNTTSKVWEEVRKEKEYKDGQCAQVHNGILTVYTDYDKCLTGATAIAGYEASIWTNWEKVVA
jgi:hypothetical protein